MTLGMGQGAFAPPAQDDDPLVAAIRGLLPERSADDQAHGEIPVSFGHGATAETLRIPVLNSRPNRAWQEKVREAGTKLVADLDGDETGTVVLGLLTGAVDLQLDLLAAYNPELLSREFVENRATDEQILAAFLGVVAAAYPFPAKLTRVLLSNREVARWIRLQMVRFLYSRSTSSSPPNTDGAPADLKTS